MNLTNEQIEVCKRIARAAGELLSDPDKRCVGKSAVDKHGHFVPSFSDRACKWCLVGALEHERGANGTKAVSRWDVAEYARKVLNCECLVDAWENGKYCPDLSVSRNQDEISKALLSI